MGLKKCVNKLSLDGSIVATYVSANEAAQSNGISKYQVFKSCNGQPTPINGFKYAYTGEYSNKKEDTHGDFKCPYCDREFETLECLRKHASRTHKDKTKEEFLTDFMYGGIRPKCKCGCGGYTQITYDGGMHFRDYIRGHQSRINNNWGHNKVAQEKSADTRRQQYKEGTRTQWNQGLSYIEAYGKEKAYRLSQEISDRLSKRIHNGRFEISSKLEKYFEDNVLGNYDVEYIKQYYFKEIKQYCDFFIPSKNIVIEIDGTFWHCDPRFYTNGPLYEAQENKVVKDKIKESYCKDKNITIFRFWEHDIKEHINHIKEFLNRAIFPQETLDDYIASLDVNTEKKFIVVNLEEDDERHHYPSYFRDMKNNDTVLIYEDEWRDKAEIVKSRIRNILGITSRKIYARKCVIKEVNYNDSKEFLEKNHLQGNSTSGKIRLGLYLEEELVALMTFCGLRKNLGHEKKDGEYELLRYCNKCHTNVIGGASKLFKAFIELYGPNKVISYSDKRWGNGGMYYNLDMEKIHESDPSYFYVIQRQRHNRFGYRKDILVKEGYDKSMSEHEIMISRRIYRIYDSGTDVFEWKNYKQ